MSVLLAKTFRSSTLRFALILIGALLLGALILERLFQIPGVGGLLVDSVFNNDRPIVMAVTYWLSIAYCAMLLVTDICYTLADPRVSLH